MNWTPPVTVPDTWRRPSPPRPRLPPVFPYYASVQPEPSFAPQFPQYDHRYAPTAPVAGPSGFRPSRVPSAASEAPDEDTQLREALEVSFDADQVGTVSLIYSISISRKQPQVQAREERRQLFRALEESREIPESIEDKDERQMEWARRASEAAEEERRLDWAQRTSNAEEDERRAIRESLRSKGKARATVYDDLEQLELERPTFPPHRPSRGSSYDDLLHVGRGGEIVDLPPPYADRTPTALGGSFLPRSSLDPLSRRASATSPLTDKSLPPEPSPEPEMTQRSLRALPITAFPRVGFASSPPSTIGSGRVSSTGLSPSTSSPLQSPRPTSVQSTQSSDGIRSESGRIGGSRRTFTVTSSAPSLSTSNSSEPPSDEERESGDLARDLEDPFDDRFVAGPADEEDDAVSLWTVSSLGGGDEGRSDRDRDRERPRDLWEISHARHSQQAISLSMPSSRSPLDNTSNTPSDPRHRPPSPPDLPSLSSISYPRLEVSRRPSMPLQSHSSPAVSATPMNPPAVVRSPTTVQGPNQRQPHRTHHGSSIPYRPRSAQNMYLDAGTGVNRAMSIPDHRRLSIPPPLPPPVPAGLRRDYSWRSSSAETSFPAQPPPPPRLPPPPPRPVLESSALNRTDSSTQSSSTSSYSSSPSQPPYPPSLSRLPSYVPPHSSLSFPEQVPIPVYTGGSMSPPVPTNEIAGSRDEQPSSLTPPLPPRRPSSSSLSLPEPGSTSSGSSLPQVQTMSETTEYATTVNSGRGLTPLPSDAESSSRSPASELVPALEGFRWGFVPSPGSKMNLKAGQACPEAVQLSIYSPNGRVGRKEFETFAVEAATWSELLHVRFASIVTCIFRTSG
jgi:hypothetical protein